MNGNGKNEVAMVAKDCWRAPHATWGTVDIFTGRLPADVCYWEATAKTKERGINAGL